MAVHHHYYHYYYLLLLLLLTTRISPAVSPKIANLPVLSQEKAELLESPPNPNRLTSSV